MPAMLLRAVVEEHRGRQLPDIRSASLARQRGEVRTGTPLHGSRASPAWPCLSSSSLLWD